MNSNVTSTDKRRRRSFFAFRDAMCKLLEKKTFDEIFVKEIFELAGYSRTAFYSNYADKNDFAYRIVDNEISKFAKSISSIRQKYPPADCTPEKLRPSVTEIFEYVYANRKIYEMILLKNIVPNPQHYFCERCYKESLLESKTKAGPPSSRQHDNYISYILNYCYIASTVYWIHDGFSITPKQIANLFCNLFCLYTMAEGEENPFHALHCAANNRDFSNPLRK